MKNDYKNLVKSNALLKLDALIRYFHFDYNDICKFINEKREEYFTKEELAEILITLEEFTRSWVRFDTYCDNRGLKK